jgi:hypothetical protein
MFYATSRQVAGGISALAHIDAIGARLHPIRRTLSRLRDRDRRPIARRCTIATALAIAARALPDLGLRNGSAAAVVMTASSAAARANCAIMAWCDSLAITLYLDQGVAPGAGPRAVSGPFKNNPRPACRRVLRSWRGRSPSTKAPAGALVLLLTAPTGSFRATRCARRCATASRPLAVPAGSVSKIRHRVSGKRHSLSHFRCAAPATTAATLALDRR